MIYDVIVVGAGPAGSTVAKYLAEKGVNILLLDKDCFPRDKPCAGGLCSHISQFKYLCKYLKPDSTIIQNICRGSVTYIPYHKQAYTYTADQVVFYNVYRLILIFY